MQTKENCSDSEVAYIDKSETKIKKNVRHDAQHVSICRHLGALGGLPIGYGVAKAASESEPVRLQAENVRGSLDLCLIEFCAGKALLAKQACTMLARASDSTTKSTSHSSSGTPTAPRVDVVLIDRTEVRHDAFMSTQERTSIESTKVAGSPKQSKHNVSTFDHMELQCTRLTVDIADLCLERLLQFQRCGQSVAMGKHLCGVATDLTLRCYVRALATASDTSACETDDDHRQRNAREQKSDETANVAHAVDSVDSVDNAVRGGVALALCCHHLCEWDGYIDTQWLSRHGIQRGEFALMKRLATKYRTHPCRQHRPRSKSGKYSPRRASAMAAHEQQDFVRWFAQARVLTLLSHACAGSLRRPRELAATAGAHLAAARASCGIMAKRCLNEGRAAWLRSQPGWDDASVRLVRFVPENDSPENFLLVGRFARGEKPNA
jgi:hypothetical protein